MKILGASVLSKTYIDKKANTMIHL
jgi:hypothetical protein